MSGKRNISVVPWYNPEQFAKVHKAIFSNDVTKIRWAVDQISVWETRCHPALPTAIEATVVLCRAIIQDILHDNITSLCQDSDIQYIYSLALVRFVNLTLELRQNAKEKLPLARVAKMDGLPSWILDLRNQATHSYCPSLPVLRAGADHAMKYLKRTFWEAEENQIQSYIRDVRDEESKIFDLITSFKEYKYKEIKEEVECTEEIKKVVDEMRKYMKENRIRFIELLTYPGMFLFNDEELYSILKGIDDKFLKDDAHIDLPDVLEYFWDKILNLIVRYDLTGDFVELLLLSQEERDPLSKKLAVSWVYTIIQAIVYRKGSSLFLTYFNAQGVFLDWTRLLYACCKYPCSQTPTLLPIITTHMNLDREEISPLMYLVAIFLGHAVDKSKISNVPAFKMFTVEDAKQRRKIEDRKRRKNVTEGNLWAPSEDYVDLTTLPIGAVLNPVEDPSSSAEENVEENNENIKNASVEEIDADFNSDAMDDSYSDNEKSTDDENYNVDNILADVTIDDDMVYRRKPKQ